MFLATLPLMVAFVNEEATPVARKSPPPSPLERLLLKVDDEIVSGGIVGVQESAAVEHSGVARELAGDDFQIAGTSVKHTAAS